jgi:hypothetical protein
MMKRSAILSLFTACAVFSPRVVTCQFDALASLAGGFSDLGVSWGPLFPIHSDVRSERHQRGRSLRWYGAEFLFEIGSAVAAQGPPADYKQRCKVERDKATERRITYTHGQTDSVDIYTVKTSCEYKPSRLWQLELGIGYSETSRFFIATPEGVISGLVREAPSLGVYANYLKVAGCEKWSVVHRLRACWDKYFGLHTGVTALVDPSLTAPPATEEFSGGTPKSVQIGGLVGLANDILPVLTIFSEVGYVYRPFPRIKWSQTDSSVPQIARTRLDLSAWMLSIGLQLRVKDPKKG